MKEVKCDNCGKVLEVPDKVAKMHKEGRCSVICGWQMGRGPLCK